MTFFIICCYESLSSLAGVAVLEVEYKGFWKQGSYWVNLRTEGQLSAGPVAWMLYRERTEA